MVLLTTNSPGGVSEPATVRLFNRISEIVGLGIVGLGVGLGVDA